MAIVALLPVKSWPPVVKTKSRLMGNKALGSMNSNSTQPSENFLKAAESVGDCADAWSLQTLTFSACVASLRLLSVYAENTWKDQLSCCEDCFLRDELRSHVATDHQRQQTSHAHIGTTSTESGSAKLPICLCRFGFSKSILYCLTPNWDIDPWKRRGRSLSNADLSNTWAKFSSVAWKRSTCMSNMLTPTPGIISISLFQSFPESTKLIERLLVATSVTSPRRVAGSYETCLLQKPATEWNLRQSTFFNDHENHRAELADVIRVATSSLQRDTLQQQSNESHWNHDSFSIPG